jgi:ABC-type phosphate/phosphonate transport system substrate-binding protein
VQFKTAACIRAHTRLNVVLSEQLFSVANRNDVVGAMKLWIEALSCVTQMNLNYKVDVIGAQGEIRQRVRDQTVDVLVLDNVDFLGMSDAGLIDGIAVGSRGGHPYSVPYLLLVNQQIDSISQLRGKRAVYHLHIGAAAALAFTATLMAENHFEGDAFFESFEPTAKAANCVLPLFFAKIQACVVDGMDWEILKELNPQLGNKLKILAQSAPVLDGVVAFTKVVTEYRQIISDNLLQMHKDSLGVQILSALRSGPLIPYRPEYPDSTREFWKRYERTLTPGEQRVWRETLRPRMPMPVRNSSGLPGAFPARSGED